jgi:D-alanine transaminase
MSRVAYVNGQYVPHGEASVHIEDRGYQFADGVYEVVNIDNGQFIDLEPHLDRLDRSLDELRIAWPMSRRAMKLVMRQVITRNGIKDGLIYIQITRGVAPRNHAFPSPLLPPSIVMTARKLAQPKAEDIETAGIKVMTTEDIRWTRPDIKSVSLLPNILCKQKAAEAGCYEAWLVDRDGFVVEGSCTNAWIVTKDNEVVTRQADNSILSGITRLSFLKALEDNGIKFSERKFTVEEAYNAKEAFITASTTRIKPVLEIDGKPIGNGHPGETVAKLRTIYWNLMKNGGNLPKVPTNIRENHG